MAKIFISYRRDDSGYQSDAIHEELKHFVPNPDQDIFIDVDGIPFGADFVKYLDERVSQCDILLAIIGSRWLDATDPEKGNRRLDDPGDFVRIEIASALQRGITVVPVLLDGAGVPDAEDLPDDLKALSHRNGVTVRRETLETDIARLAAGLGLERKAAPVPKKSSGGGLGITVALLFLLGAGGAGFYFADPLNMFDKGPSFDNRRAGDIIRDTLASGGTGPQMVVMPAGQGTIGSPVTETNRDGDEAPLTDVTFADTFAVGKYEVTWDEWTACVVGGGCDSSNHTGDAGWGRGNRPIINVTWNDAKAYTAWLSRETGETYRLLTEAEWEYAARAGATGRYYWGIEAPICAKGLDNGAVFDACEQKTQPVGFSEANPYGLHDTIGNVWEWVEDCWSTSYADLKADGSAQTGGDCSKRVMRGGSYFSKAGDIRLANRRGDLGPTARRSNVGFRVARDVTD